MMYLLSENEKKTILEIIRQKNPWVETDYYTFLTVEEDMLNSVLQNIGARHYKNDLYKVGNILISVVLSSIYGAKISAVAGPSLDFPKLLKALKLENYESEEVTLSEHFMGVRLNLVDRESYLRDLCKNLSIPFNRLNSGKLVPVRGYQIWVYADDDDPKKFIVSIES